MQQILSIHPYHTCRNPIPSFRTSLIADAKAEAAEAEIERLKGELREAKGREEALRDALALLGPGGQAMAAAGAQ